MRRSVAVTETVMRHEVPANQRVRDRCGTLSTPADRPATLLENTQELATRARPLASAVPAAAAGFVVREVG